MSSRHVLILGAGVGGLSAAIRLAARGHRVTVLEKNPRVGGKLNRWVAPHPGRPGERPFVFDTGPSLVTLPFVFEDLFKAAGTRLADHLDLVKLDPIASYRWSDGTRLDEPAGVEAFGSAVAGMSPGDEAGWLRLAAKAANVWNLSADMFLQHAPEQVLAGKAGESKGLRAALEMLTVPFRIGMFQKYRVMIDREIRHPRLREVLYQYATYSGASPFRAPATLAVIPYAEVHFGGWYPRGGMYRIAEALEAVARGLGVEIRVGCEVAEVLVEPGVGKKGKPRAVGARLVGGGEVKAEVVVCNSDVVYSYRRLIPAAYRRKYSDRALDRLEPGGAGMVLLLGVEGTYPQLSHHTKFMPDDYKSDLRAMFETKRVPADPCIYVCATTRTDETQAPAGCENLFVLASAPAIDGRLDWASAGRRYRDQLVGTLERKWGLTDLAKRIVVERAITPADLQGLYNANAGSIYGISSNSLRTAFLRPPNRDTDIEGLFFVGGATHPGGGLPLVALSGKIVAELIDGE